jgi:hypothetical protein
MGFLLILRTDPPARHGVTLSALAAIDAVAHGNQVEGDHHGNDEQKFDHGCNS